MEQWILVGVAVLFLFVIVCMIALRRLARKISELKHEQVNQSESQAIGLSEINAIHSQIAAMQSRIEACDTSQSKFGQSINEVADHLAALQRQVQQLSEREPGDKLYSKAAKLVQSGASVEELMQECELPRAEAELLHTLHQTSRD